MTEPLPASSSTHQGTRDQPLKCKDVAIGESGEKDAAAAPSPPWGPLASNVKGTGRRLARCFELQDSCLLTALTHHRPRMLPFGQLVQDPKQINTRKEVPPAKLVIVTCFLQGKPRNNHLLHSCRCPAVSKALPSVTSALLSLSTCVPGTPSSPQPRGTSIPEAGRG